MKAKDTMKATPIPMEKLIDEAIKMGRKEVVDWIEAGRIPFFTFSDLYRMDGWDKRLREWDL